jgi:uridine phosphorylase
LLAQAVLTEPKMFNHSRGLWGYTGPGPDGRPMTIQSTGIGGPSAAIVITELLELGARRLVRVGTCRGLGAAVALGDLVVAARTLPADGTSHSLGARDPLHGDPGLTRALAVSGEAEALTVVSTDLFYGLAASEAERWRRDGAVAVDMETATLLALAARAGVRAASILAVAELPGPARTRLGADALREVELRMGGLAAGALALGGSATAPAGRSRSRSVPAAPQ